MNTSALISGTLTVAAFLVGWSAIEAVAQEKTVAVDGINIHYVDVGVGEPIVLVHGAISDLRVWSSQLPVFAESFRAIAYTQRYYGGEPWADAGEKYSDATQAEDLIALIKALNLGPVHLFTWSNGGSIGTLAALKEPGLFRSIVHYEPVWDQFLETTDEGNASFTEISAALGPRNDAVDAGDLDAGVELMVDAVWETPGAFDGLTPEAQSMLRQQGRTLTLTEGDLPEASCEMLGKLTIPTRVLLGADTKLAYFRLAAEGIAECMADGELVSIPGATHGGPILKAAAVNAETIEFFKAH